MKFLCLECDEVMGFEERQLPGDGTMAAVFSCGGCGREMAMLANPMETRLVSGMGVKVGGRNVPEQPMELTRSQLADGRPDAFQEPEGDLPAGEDAPGEGDGEGEADGAPAGAGGSGGPVEWSPDAVARLQKVPSFVRGMVKRIYTDYARERGIEEMTPELMDRARSELGLEGM